MTIKRSFLAFAFAALLLAILIPCRTVHGDTQKAETLDELAARYDSTSCKECHEEEYTQWEKSAHARSMVGSGYGRTRATLKTLVTRGLMTWQYSGVKKPEDVKIKHLMGCAKCHLPQLAEATDEVAQEIVKAVWAKDNETLNKLNINCLICHQRNAITHKWVYGYPQKNTVYGTHDGEHDSEEQEVLKRSPNLSESIMCGQCHGLGPQFELEQPTQCATAYGSHLWAYIPEGGTQSCQDCHMKKFNKGHTMPAYRDLDMQDAAVDMDIDVSSYHWRKNKAEGVVPMALVKVALTNKTGHGIPDG